MARGGQGRQGPTQQRSCLGCRQVRPKGELLRLVLAPAGLVVDRGQRLPGRGAYLCAAPACVQKAARMLGKALRAGGLGLGPEQLGRLIAGEVEAVAASVAPQRGSSGGESDGTPPG